MNALNQPQEAKRYVNLQTEEISSLPQQCWMKGYLIGYSSLDGTAGTQLIHPRIELEWSLETGGSVFQELMLPNWDEDGDGSYEKLLTIFNVLPFQVNFLDDLLIQTCGLLVTAEWITDEESGRLVYELHDLCSLDDLQRNRSYNAEKSERAVN